MTVYTAENIWRDLRQGDEGFLDTAKRIESERPLTDREREAMDVLWEQVIESLWRFAELVR